MISNRKEKKIIFSIIKFKKSKIFICHYTLLPNKKKLTPSIKDKNNLLNHAFWSCEPEFTSDISSVTTVNNLSITFAKEHVTNGDNTLKLEAVQNSFFRIDLPISSGDIGKTFHFKCHAFFPNAPGIVALSNVLSNTSGANMTQVTISPSNNIQIIELTNIPLADTKSLRLNIYVTSAGQGYIDNLNLNKR